MRREKVNEHGQADLSTFSLTTVEAEIALESINHEDRVNVIEVILTNNRLEYVPETLKLFTNMQFLWLGANCIKHLPDWIGDLTALKKLGINNNVLCEIPRSIGKLTNLKGLYCENNQLSSVPSSLVKLTKLCDIQIYNNCQLPPHLRVYISNDHFETRVFLHMVALEEWRPRARAASIRWMLIASCHLGICKDIAVLIGRMVYKSRGEDVWEF